VCARARALAAIVLCLWPVLSPAGLTEAQEALARDGLGHIWASVTPWALALGATVPVLLVVIILLEWRSARWAKTFQELYRTFADDRQREREAYLRLVAQARLAGEERTLEQAEAAATELVKALEQARAEIAALAERLQGR